MQRDVPPLTALRSFEAVARHLSFTKAAGELNVTHAAVSQQVKALEGWLGLKLFKRSGPRISLTDIGYNYFQPVHDAFDGIATATNALRKVDQQRPIEVTTTSAFASRWLIPRLARFQAAHPDIMIKMSPSGKLMCFEQDDVDIGIRYGDGMWEDVDAVPLVGGELVVLCSPKLLQCEHPLLTPNDLKYHSVIRDESHDIYNEWQRWFDANNIVGIDLTKRRIDYSEATYAYQATIEGLGVYMGVYSLALADIETGRLIMPFGKDLLTKGRYHVVSRKGVADRPAVKAFRDWLLEESQLDDFGFVNGLANQV